MMQKNLLLLIFIISLSSCSQKVYFFEADKLENVKRENIDIEVDAFFSGDALDYVVFEIDVRNNTNDTLHLDYRNVYLKIKDSNKTFYALNKADLIYEAEERQLELKREKRARDIGNAITIGLDLLLIGTGNANAIDAIIYSTETAAYMMEDARAHKLLKGTLDEQITYIEDWVIYKEKVPPYSEDTWDVLFERQLFDSNADIVLKVNDVEYAIPFTIKTIEEKVR